MTTTLGLRRNGTIVFLTAFLVSLAACDQGNDNQLVGHDGAFDSLSLATSGGMPWPPRDGDECDTSYKNVVSVDAASSSITWDMCGYDSVQGHTLIQRGSRTLDPTELETVRQTLSTVQVGNHGYCGADKATVTLDVQSNGTLGRYVDDFYGCRPAPDGRTFVENIDQLGYVLWGLKPPVSA